jgi:hypothetical protein
MLAFLRDLVSRARAAVKAWKAPIQDHNDTSVIASKSPPQSEMSIIPANDTAKESEISVHLMTGHLPYRQY